MLGKSLCPAVVAGIVSAVVWTGAAFAQKKYDPGASDTPKSRSGQTMPYSGPASSYSTIGPAEMKAYFDKINAEGGVNGRKITLLRRRTTGLVSSKTVEAHAQAGRAG